MKPLLETFAENQIDKKKKRKCNYPDIHSHWLPLLPWKHGPHFMLLGTVYMLVVTYHSATRCRFVFCSSVFWRIVYCDCGAKCPSLPLQYFLCCIDFHCTLACLFLLLEWRVMCCSSHCPHCSSHSSCSALKLATSGKLSLWCEASWWL